MYDKVWCLRKMYCSSLCVKILRIGPNTCLVVKVQNVIIDFIHFTWKSVYVVCILCIYCVCVYSSMISDDDMQGIYQQLFLFALNSMNYTTLVNNSTVWWNVIVRCDLFTLIKQERDRVRQVERERKLIMYRNMLYKINYNDF